MVILDGRSLARRREHHIAGRAAHVRATRGHAPTLLLAAFADDQGRVPHLSTKLRACERMNVHAAPLVLRAGCSTAEAVHALEKSIRDAAADAVFVQVPTPEGVAEEALLDVVPPELDVDIMTPASSRAYMRGEHDLPPVTIRGALHLLDACEVKVSGLQGVLVAEGTSYSAMIAEAFRRRGAELVAAAPDAADLAERTAQAALVIAAAGRPGLISTGTLRAGCIALDFGYYNDGGRGDIDTAPGSGHLGALMPVPGGVGPMTVSALLERTVAFAEG